MAAVPDEGGQVEVEAAPATRGEDDHMFSLQQSLLGHVAARAETCSSQGIVQKQSSSVEALI